MEQVQRLDILLAVICDSEQPTARFVLDTVLAPKFGISDPDDLSNEIDILLEILKSDDLIMEEQSSHYPDYRATMSGIEFKGSGGYTADHQAKEKLKLKKERKENIAIIISIIALVISTFFSIINYRSDNPTKRIDQLEKRIDSMQSAKSISH